jgi:hypothetical protein
MAWSSSFGTYHQLEKVEAMEIMDVSLTILE